MSAADASATRAVVVDDSHFMRTLIRTLLEDGGIEVVAEASDGDEAVDAVAAERPDVVTMDIEMPRADGIQAVEGIMRECPTPVLMLSAHAEEGAEVTFEALEKGAVDFVTKPGGEVSSEMTGVKHELVEKVRSVATADVSAAVSTGRSGSGGGSTGRGSADADAGSGAGQSASSADAAASTTGTAVPDGATVLVGASTGGPNVVEGVLGGFPAAANLRVIVVQHMPDGFTGRFADRLDRRCPYRVREARDGERMGPGEVRIAPGGRHLSVTDDRAGRLRLELEDGDPVHGVKPAIDPAMTSAAANVDGPLAAVLLTGMGRDGVDGMGAVRRAGGRTVAQDENTSAIFGMPKRAIEAGAVHTVLPADRIAEGVLHELSEV